LFYYILDFVDNIYTTVICVAWFYELVQGRSRRCGQIWII